MLDEIEIARFKQIEYTKIPLAKINVFVGGNNSGKSCILQGIHFGIALSQARRIAGAYQFPPEQLRYCPTDDFLNLNFRRRLTEGTTIDFSFRSQDGFKDTFAKVSLTRGRNGVVKAQANGSELLNEISDPKGFFSIYVPGLAGISIREEYRSELVMNNGIARGDANLFLRNLLLRIERSIERKVQFLDAFQRVFPGASVQTYFSEPDDLFIRSVVNFEDGRSLPIDMVGTGMLQAIQLIAYVTMYAPKLLLLDEPDAHLHPSNQKLLADVLSAIVKNSQTKILIATHSRHLLDAFSEVEEAKLLWVKNGSAFPQSEWSDIAVLMDLGALDKGEKLLNGSFKYLIWTEDSDVRFLQKFLEANNVSQSEAFIFSYQASSKIDSAKLMGAFVQRVRPGVKTIIHRDRDFMSDEEIVRLRAKYAISDTNSVQLFITKGSDIESYFATAAHVSEVYGMSLTDAQAIIDETIQQNQVDFVMKFQSKRTEIKIDLYKKDPKSCPSPEDLLTGNVIPPEKTVGKLLLKRLNNSLSRIPKDPTELVVSRHTLADDEFQSLL